MKVNLDLTKTNPNNDISDELHTDVGASAFSLEHDFFYGSTDLEIWTGAGQTGTQLVENTDYTLGGINDDLTTRAGVNIYSTVTVDNVTYQTGNLYFTYHACADFVDATDSFNIVKTSGQYIKLLDDGGLDINATHAIDIATNTQSASLWAGSARVWVIATNGLASLVSSDSNTYVIANGGAQNVEISADDEVRISANDTTATAIDISAVNGGIDVDSAAGMTFNDDSGAYLTMSSAGVVDLRSATNQNLEVRAQGTGSAILRSLLGQVYLNAAGDTSATSVFIESQNGGISVESSLDTKLRSYSGGITFQDQYLSTAIPISQSGTTGLSGFTATSIVGALNELKSGGGGSSLDDAYNAGSAITVDTTDVDWNLGTGRDFRIYDATDANKFVITQGTGASSFKVDTTGGVDIDVDGGFALNDDSGAYFTMSAAGVIYLSAANDAGFALMANGTSSLAQIIAEGSIILNTSATNSTAINIDSSGGIDIDAAGVVSFTTTSTAANAIDINSSGGVDIDTTGSGIISLQSYGASVYTAALTLSSSTISLISTYVEASDTPPNIQLISYANTSGNEGGRIFINTNCTSGAIGGDITLITDGTGTVGNIEITGNDSGYVRLQTQQNVAGTGGNVYVTTGNYSTGTGGTVEISTFDSGSGTAGKIVINSTNTAADALNVDSSGGIDIDAADLTSIESAGGIEIYATNSATDAVGIYSNGGVDIVTTAGIATGFSVETQGSPLNISSSYSGGSTGGNITIKSANSSSGTGGNILLQTTASAGTAGAIDIETNSTNRVAISAGGDTVFYGTASTTGSLPVVTLDQADTDEPFLKFIGDAASADLTRDLVDTGDVTTPTIVGYLKIEILDDGDQITDGDYYIPFYSLA